MTDITAVPGKLSRETTCKSCGAPIAFIRLKTGRYNPVDANSRAPVVPDRNGRPWVTIDGEVIYATEDRAGEILAYRSHFATCTNAGAHRKGKRKD